MNRGLCHEEEAFVAMLLKTDSHIGSGRGPSAPPPRRTRDRHASWHVSL